MQRNSAYLKLIGLLLVSAVLAGCMITNSTNQNASATKPTMSKPPISGRAVYTIWTSQDPAVSQIFMKNFDTGEVKQLTQSENNSNPVWSPDGSQILFLSWTQANSFDILVMDQDGKNQRPVVGSPASEMNARWSPDGKKIVFDSNEDGRYEIYVMDLQTQGKVKLTDGAEGMRGAPDWSPDGSKIAFVSSKSPSGKSQLMVMNANGGAIQPLTEDGVNSDDKPVWCPDASSILFTRVMGAPTQLMRLDLSRKTVTPFLGKKFAPEKMEFASARSVSGKYITFSVDGAFYAMDMKSGELYPLEIQARDLSLDP